MIITVNLISKKLNSMLISLLSAFACIFFSVYPKKKKDKVSYFSHVIDEKVRFTVVINSLKVI